MSFAVREERPPLMGMWLISTEAGDMGTWGPQTLALPNQGRMLCLSLGLVKVTLLLW